MTVVPVFVIRVVVLALLIQARGTTAPTAHTATARLLIARALTLAAEVPDGPQLIPTLGTIAEVAYRLDDEPTAMKCAVRASQHCGSAAAYRPLVEGWIHKGHMERVTQLIEELPDELQRDVVRSWLIKRFIELKKLEEAAKHVKDVNSRVLRQTIAAELDAHRCTAGEMTIEAFLAMHSRNVGRSPALMLLVEAHCAQHKFAAVVSMIDDMDVPYDRTIALLRLALNDPDHRAAYVKAAVNMIEGIGSSAQRADALISLARAQYRIGDLENARLAAKAYRAIEQILPPVELEMRLWDRFESRLIDESWQEAFELVRSAKGPIAGAYLLFGEHMVHAGQQDACLGLVESLPDRRDAAELLSGSSLAILRLQ